MFTRFTTLLAAGLLATAIAAPAHAFITGNGKDVNGTINGSMNGAINGMLNGIYNASINGTLNGSYNASINGSFNGSINGSLNGGHSGIDRQPFDGRILMIELPKE